MLFLPPRRRCPVKDTAAAGVPLLDTIHNSTGGGGGISSKFFKKFDFFEKIFLQEIR
jgi:hypothetical protein